MHVVRYMFVWDQREVRSTMAQYVSREPAMGLVDVPGDSRQCKVVSDTARNITTAMTYWMIRLHNNGFSLDGALPIHGYGFCVDRTGSLKGMSGLFDMLVPLDEVRISTDMNALANFALQHLYQTHRFGAVPPEV
jgi:hypothetical protein